MPILAFVYSQSPKVVPFIKAHQLCSSSSFDQIRSSSSLKLG